VNEGLEVCEQQAGILEQLKQAGEQESPYREQEMEQVSPIGQVPEYFQNSDSSVGPITRQL